MSEWKKILTLVGSFGTACVPVLASAQASDKTTASGDSLQEIVVTSQRREESLQKVPVSVVAVSAAGIKEAHIVDLQQLVSVAPSLQISSINNQAVATNFAIRGIGTGLRGPFLEQSTGIVIDDIAMSRTFLAAVQLFDLERVEVLSGPQGMLFGKNASAGLVNIVTAQPKIDEFEALGSAGYSRLNSAGGANIYSADAALNLPISQNAAIRISGFYNYQDGFVDKLFRDDFSGMKENGFRAKWLLQADDHWTVLVAGDYTQERGPGTAVFTFSYAQPGGFADTHLAALGGRAYVGNLNDYSGAPQELHFNVGGFSSNISYQSDYGLTFTNIAGYRRYADYANFDGDELPLNVAQNTNIVMQQYDQFTEEFRVASNSNSQLQYQAGLFHLSNNNRFQGNQAGNGEGCAPGVCAGFTYNPANAVPAIGHYIDEYGTSRSDAVYGQLTYAFFPSLRVFGGGRFTRDNVTANTVNQKVGSVLNQLTAAGPPFGSVSVNKNNFSYKLGVQYDLASNVMLFATYARGYKGPGVNILDLRPLQPEIPKAWEGGIKSSFFDNRLVLNLTGYDEKIKNFQTQAYSAITFTPIATNAGELETRGVEGQIMFRPLHGLTLNTSFNLSDPKYNSFVGVPCYAGQPVGVGINLCNPTTRVSDASGDQLSLASKVSILGTIRYELDVGSSSRAMLSFGFNHRSSFNYNSLPDPNTNQPAYTTYDVNAGVGSQDDHWMLTAFVKNLTDERIPTVLFLSGVARFIGDGAKGDYLQQYDKNSFRQVGLRLDYKF